MITKQQLLDNGFVPLERSMRQFYQSYSAPCNALDVCFAALDAFWTEPVYAVCNGCLLVAVNESDGYMFLPPAGDFEAGIKKLDEMFIAPPIGYLSPKQAALLNRSVVFDDAFADYITTHESIVNLSWQYKHKTADYNAFAKKHSYEIIPLDKCDKSIFYTVLDAWCAARSCTGCLFGCEKDALTRYLDNPDNGAVGFAVIADGIPAGTIIGTVEHDTLFIPYAKTDKRFNGLSVFMFVTLAQMYPAPIVNLGSDGGIEGLRRFKHKFEITDMIQKGFTQNRNEV